MKLVKHSFTVFNGESSFDHCTEHLTRTDIFKMKHSPTVSRDVQRLFSKYKNTLADNRREFLFQNLMRRAVIRCND
jgi:hypothetical protein